MFVATLTSRHGITFILSRKGHWLSNCADHTDPRIAKFTSRANARTAINGAYKTRHDTTKVIPATA